MGKGHVSWRLVHVAGMQSTVQVGLSNTQRSQLKDMLLLG